MPVAAIREFFKLESAGGICLFFAAVIAIILDNSPLAWLYDSLLTIPVAVKFGALEIAKPLLLWINDGLMAVFFFLIGLEIKREALEGQLSSVNQIALPGVAAIGGMAVPAAIYAYFNWSNPVDINGWAIPGSDRYRVCAWHPDVAGQPRAACNQGLSDRGRNHRRSRCDCDHRSFLYRQPVIAGTRGRCCRSVDMHIYEFARRHPGRALYPDRDRRLGRGAEIRCPCDARRRAAGAQHTAPGNGCRRACASAPSGTYSFIPG